MNKLSEINPDIIKPIKLDITKEEDIQECVKRCSDTNILINNAGIELKSDFLNSNASKKATIEMKVNFIGAVELTNSFIENLETKSNFKIINILSIASLVFIKNIGTYCASKVALHIYTQSIREELKGKIEVYGVYPVYVDTSMVSDVDIEKITPQELVKNICDEISLGNLDVFPNKMAKKYLNSTKLELEYLI